MKVKQHLTGKFTVILTERQLTLLGVALGKLSKLESLSGSDMGELSSFLKGLTRCIEIAKIAAPRKYKPRTKMTLEEIDKINMLWFVEKKNRSQIGRALLRSSQACEKYLFKTKQEWLHWSENLRKD